MAGALETDATARRRMALRIGLGVALTFTACELSDITLPFLPAVLLGVMLAGRPAPFSIIEGIAAPLAFALVGGVVLMIAGWLLHLPVAYLLAMTLLLFFGFLLSTTGRAMPAGLVLVLTVAIGATAAQSASTAGTLAFAMTQAAAIGVVAAWLMFAIFPPIGDTKAAPVALAAPRPGRAFVDTLILLPVFYAFAVSDDLMACVVLITIVNLLRLADRSMAPRAMLGLLAGNALGGLLAVLAYGAVTLLPHPVFLCLVVALVALPLGGGIAAGGPRAPLFQLALVSFLILFGLGISPLPSDTGTAFVNRLFDVLAASVYAVAAIAVASRWDRARDDGPGPAALRARPAG